MSLGSSLLYEEVFAEAAVSDVNLHKTRRKGEEIVEEEEKRNERELGKRKLNIGQVMWFFRVTNRIYLILIKLNRMFSHYSMAPLLLLLLQLVLYVGFVLSQ